MKQHHGSFTETYFWLHNYFAAPTGVYISLQPYDVEFATRLDVKFDDGNINTGNMRSLSNTYIFIAY